MPVVPNKTLGYIKIEPELYIYVSASDKAPSNEDWEIYLQFLKQHLRTEVVTRCIVYERCDGISAVQRKRLRDVTGPFKPIVAVLTTSSMAKGIVTALSWFNKRFKAFSPEDKVGALQHIGLQPSMADSVWRLIQRLSDELDGKPIMPSQLPSALPEQRPSTLPNQGAPTRNTITPRRGGDS
jgi:hypothetical protein